jgi:hypothetical protein
MKYTLTFILAALLPLAGFANTGTLESIVLNSEEVSVSFEDSDKTLVLTFTDKHDQASHSVIDLRRIKDLEYKTRVMRYFGGLLVNDTYHFKNLVVLIEGRRMQYNWSRANVSTLVKKMCLKADQIV